MTPDAIESRKPIWLALAEFFTDPEPGAADLVRIAAVLLQQGITFAKAEEIIAVEVAPAFMGSIWYAFYPPFMWGVGEEDLVEQIVRHYDPKCPPKLLFSALLWRWMVSQVVGKRLESLKPHLA